MLRSFTFLFFSSFPLALTPPGIQTEQALSFSTWVDACWVSTMLALHWSEELGLWTWPWSLLWGPGILYLILPSEVVWPILWLGNSQGQPQGRDLSQSPVFSHSVPVLMFWVHPPYWGNSTTSTGLPLTLAFCHGWLLPAMNIDFGASGSCYGYEVCWDPLYASTV